MHTYHIRNQHIKLRNNLTVDEGTNLERNYTINVHHNLTKTLTKKPTTTFIYNPNSLHIPITLEYIHTNITIFMKKPQSNQIPQQHQPLVQTQTPERTVNTRLLTTNTSISPSKHITKKCPPFCENSGISTNKSNFPYPTTYLPNRIIEPP